jgi:arylsulfatase A-like enzyme
MFSSDHGEGMGEHNYYFAHGDYLYNHQTHVPLIVKHGSELKGKRTDFVQHLDIVPTLLNVAGSTPEGRFRGYDLRNTDAPPREIFAETRPGKSGKDLKLSLIHDGFKLIYTPIIKKHELFNIKTDHREEQDIIKDTKYLEKAKDMAVRLQRVLNDDHLGLRNVSRPKKLTAEELEKLKSLGYAR